MIRVSDLERRRNTFNERVAGGFGIGVPLATLIAWGLELKGVNMPTPVSAALGAVITAIVICLTQLGRRLCDLIRYVARLYFLGRRK